MSSSPAIAPAGAAQSEQPGAGRRESEVDDIRHGESLGRHRGHRYHPAEDEQPAPSPVRQYLTDGPDARRPMGHLESMVEDAPAG